MPIDDLTALGQKMREARKNKELTQQELSDLSHVSVKQIANIGTAMGGRNVGSFIGYTGSISVPVVFQYDKRFYSKMI